MDNTLDPIRPSYNHNPQDEMSYLFGRDPSILAYGQRPCVSKDAKKNLLSAYECEEYDYVEENGSLNSESQTLQTAKVYLRMKPFPKKLKLSQEQLDAYKIVNSTTLFTKIPMLDNNISCFKKSSSNDIVCKKFTFTKTFGPETTQLELFDQAVKQQMLDFLGGQNFTIMTYGTTNSGKSYTLQGTTTSPGIIPRCLEFVFSNISTKSTPSYKPINHCDVIALDPLERAQELEIKTKLLTFASVDKYQYINAYKEMQKLLQEESPIRPSHCTDRHYSVWVSFAEIYNEVIYDLLSNECQKKRTPLKLATDSQGRAFIKGLKTICVNSGSEAYQVLMAGQYNLKVAATALNARSSRSHCIFTINLLKYYVENNPNSVEVSKFAFCDLAGSERLKKTLNIGDRLREAQNINTSLLVLGRCLKTIHEGQLMKQKIEQIGPFRESKLTRLFQKALSGKEQIALIVNINPIPNLYIETQNVLNFSAIAKKIVIEKEKKHKKVKSRFSQIVTQSIKTVTDWDATELESTEWRSTDTDNTASHYVQVEDYDDLIRENEKLRKEIAALKGSALTRDLQIRQEMADTCTSIVKKLESEWKEHIKHVEEQQEDVLQLSVQQVEEFYKQKLEQLNSRKRRRDDSGDDSKNIEELEIENSHLTSKIVVLRSSLRDLKETNQILTVEKNKVTFELSLIKEDLKNAKSLLNAAQQDVCSDEDAKYYIEELQSQLFAKQEQVMKLKEFLNEAKEEYIAVTTDIEKKEYVIKRQEEELFEKQETIDDLEAELRDLNICLTEKVKAVDILEQKLETQIKKFLSHEHKLQDMQDAIYKLENEKLSLLDELELIKKTVVSRKSVNESNNLEFNDDDSGKCHDPLKDDKKIVIKEELSPNLKIEIVTSNSTKSSDMGTQTEDEQLEIQIKEKVIAIEGENSVLKEKLVRSTTEIQSLKEELESAKVKLKDIAEQICSLQISNVQSNIQNDENNKSKIAIETVEIGCQVEIEFDEHCVEMPKNDVLNKSIQTIENLIMKEESNQTSFIEDTDDNVIDELVKLMVKYDDIKTEYEKKCSMLEQMDRNVLLLKQEIKELSQEKDANKVDAEEYKQSIELLQKELSLLKEDKKQIQETLKSTDNIKISLEKRISDYEQRLNESEQQLSLTKSDYNQCTEKLNTLQANFDTYISKSKIEHEEIISNLQKELSSAIEKSNIKSQCLDVHAAKIVELQHDLESITELHEKISELNKNLETCQTEKDQLQKLLNENNDKLLELEDRLESAEEKEREKDTEIVSLQKEIKHMIQSNENGDRSEKLMEIELKNAIKELTTKKEMLSEKQAHIEQLEIRVKNSEQNAKVLDLLQQSAEERKVENERLRILNEELKNSLIEKEREMEAFMKNRDDMVTKYEGLVKSQQRELEERKQGSSKSCSKERDHYENTSDDEPVYKERRTRRPPKRFTPMSPTKQNEVSVIELSGSDSKRSAKRYDLPPPEQVSSKKKNTRRKKLYITEDESFQEIEPLESSIIITPSSKTHNLRSRRK